jgi:hypothetical protein
VETPTELSGFMKRQLGQACIIHDAAAVDDDYEVAVVPMLVPSIGIDTKNLHSSTKVELR